MQVPFFIVAQISGSTLAACNLKLLFHGQPDIKPAVTRVIAPTTLLQAVAWEYTITFILTIISAGVATDSRAVCLYNHFLEIKYVYICTHIMLLISILQNDKNSTKCYLESQLDLRWCSTLSLPGK